MTRAALDLGFKVRPKKRGDKWIFRLPERWPVAALMTFIVLIFLDRLVKSTFTAESLVSIVIGLLPLWALTRVLVQGFVATPTEVRVIGFFKHRSIRWDDIDAVKLGPYGLSGAGVAIILKDGTVVLNRAFDAGAASPGSSTANRKLGPLADGLNALLLDHRTGRSALKTDVSN